MKAQITILCFLLTNTLAPAALVWVPDTPSGNSFGGPFGVGVGVTERWQQIYSASAFSPVPGGGVITALAFRPDCARGQICIGTFVPDAQINFSTTAKLVDGLSTVFAQNVGADDQVAVGRGVIPLVPFQDPNSFNTLELIQ